MRRRAHDTAVARRARFGSPRRVGRGSVEPDGADVRAIQKATLPSTIVFGARFLPRQYCEAHARCIADHAREPLGPRDQCSIDWRLSCRGGLWRVFVDEVRRRRHHGSVACRVETAGHSRDSRHADRAPSPETTCSNERRLAAALASTSLNSAPQFRIFRLLQAKHLPIVSRLLLGSAVSMKLIDWIVTLVIMLMAIVFSARAGCPPGRTTPALGI